MPFSAQNTLESPFKWLWRGYLGSRVVLALLLALGALLVAPAHSQRLLLQLLILGIYGVLAGLYATVSRRPPPQRKVYAWLPTVGMDLLLISLLEINQVGTYTLTPLFGVLVLVAGSMGGWLVVLSACAYITIFLMGRALADSVGTEMEFALLQGYFQAAFAGAAYFVVGSLVRLLASRVEKDALQSLRSAAASHQQEQINALILQNLSEGVLVTNEALQVRSANPVAMDLLKQPQLPLDLGAQAGWRPVANQIAQTFREGQHLACEQTILEPQSPPIGLHVRSWLTHPLPGLGAIGSADNDPLCLVFLHDLREIEAKLRTEKMAAMGRMSAAVAHEIRNPLAAILQANALLDEDISDPGHKRLTYMVEQNAQRLGRIAEDILDIARVHSQIQPSPGETILLDEAVRTICHDWTALAPAAHDVALTLRAAESLVAFDTGHLRQLMFNLLNNAQRYRSQLPASLHVMTSSNSAGAALLQVWSDGPPIEPSIEKHLFEPFFSSESRSSGLGLYICRELCDRHGAIIRYERQAGHRHAGDGGNAFIVQFRQAAASLQ